MSPREDIFVINEQGKYKVNKARIMKKGGQTAFSPYFKAMNKEITTYQAFWPHYLREHSKSATRAWHYFGTSLALAILIFAIVTGRWGFIAAALVSGYFFAWVSHGAFEKNKPATFTYPLWSLFSDFKMLFCFLTGRMGVELKAAGVER